MKKPQQHYECEIDEELFTAMSFNSELQKIIMNELVFYSIKNTVADKELTVSGTCYLIQRKQNNKAKFSVKAKDTDSKHFIYLKEDFFREYILKGVKISKGVHDFFYSLTSYGQRAMIDMLCGFRCEWGFYKGQSKEDEGNKSCSCTFIAQGEKREFIVLIKDENWEFHLLFSEEYKKIHDKSKTYLRTTSQPDC